MHHSIPHMGGGSPEVPEERWQRRWQHAATTRGSVCTHLVVCPGVELQAVAEGIPRGHSDASQPFGGIHAIKVVGLQGARPGQTVISARRGARVSMQRGASSGQGRGQGLRWSASSRRVQTSASSTWTIQHGSPATHSPGVGVQQDAWLGCAMSQGYAPLRAQRSGDRLALRRLLLLQAPGCYCLRAADGAAGSLIRHPCLAGCRSCLPGSCTVWAG